MRPTRTRRAAAALVLVLASTAVAAPRSQPVAPVPERGWLTGLGIALAGASVTALAVLTHEALVLEDSNRRLTGYLPSPSAVPTATEAPAVNLLELRREEAQARVLPFALASAITALGALICIALDVPASLRPALSWGPGGAAVNLAISL